jgi:hypothetical protein
VKTTIMLVFADMSIHDLMVKIDLTAETYHSHEKIYNFFIYTQMKTKIYIKTIELDEI